MSIYIKGRRKPIQNIRYVDDVIAVALRQRRVDIDVREPSRFGATEHELHATLQRHEMRLTELREQEVAIPAATRSSDVTVEAAPETHAEAAPEARVRRRAHTTWRSTQSTRPVRAGSWRTPPR